MPGEGLALVSAVCFGLAGASIARGARGPGPLGDNGALLSVIISALVAGGLWAALPAPAPGDGAAWWGGVALFVLAGLLSTVLGRMTFFRSVALSGATRSSLLRRLIPVFAAVFAWGLLGETLGPADLAGMALILGGVLVAVLPRRLAGAPGGAAGLGLALGLASAAFYGGSYVARKLGMVQIPDAAFGAMVGALAGLAWFGAGALVSPRQRRLLRDLPRCTGRWQALTALSLAAGQTTLFFALARAEVAIVAVIGATEVFITALLASVLFRTEALPGPRLIAGMAAAVAGVGVLVLA